MNIYNHLEKFLESIFDIKGNISPQKFKKQYFIKQNKEFLWDWFEQQLDNFPGYSNREIVILLQHGYTEPPKCTVCNQNAKIQTYTTPYTFDYCSKSCCLKSTKRKENISNSKKGYSVEKKKEIEDKRVETNLEKYGVKYQSQRKEVSEIISEKLSKHQLGNTRDILLNEEWLNEEYNIKKRSSVDIAEELGVYYGTVISYCKKYGFKIRRVSKGSLPQKQIFEFIKEYYAGEVLFDDWETLGNLELDIFIPELNLAIEHNGLPSHSSNIQTNKIKNRHIIKTDRCKELNIDLFHIRGDQWIKQKEIVKSMILSKLNKTDKVYARKCEIRNLTVSEAKLFFQKTHIQGYSDSSIKIGLFYNSNIVSAILFSNPRFNKKYQWELIRYSNELNVTVIGGFTKLLKHFKEKYSGSIISYCDKSRSNGNVYYKSGFKLLKETKIGYYWTDNHNVYHRTNFQKHKLKDKLKLFNPESTEKENMFNNGFKLYYDCGQMVFVLE